jgi:hypothetical protein
MTTPSLYRPVRKRLREAVSGSRFGPMRMRGMRGMRG